ncbi:MAG TPA: GNAT family N-acetyltransferase [Gemmataceae bacterium]|nr:GNAT family N-acetyltransferase [Gemmataceae bacterium]
MNHLTIEAVSLGSADALLLIGRLNAELDRRFGALQEGYNAANVLDPECTFLVAYLDGRPVACGAFRSLGDGVVEVKRMFVEPDCRGRGIARRLLAELEERARRAGHATARLETGTRLHEAVGLYESAGYRRIENYGMYAGNPHSVCFEKSL